MFLGLYINRDKYISQLVKDVKNCTDFKNERGMYMGYISTMGDTKELSITVYNNEFGVIKEKRDINIDRETDVIQYLDVAQLIEIDSIIVDGVEVIELNYDYDLVSKEKLMEKYIDKTVILHNKEEKTKEQYRLLSVKGGMVLEKVDTKEIIINPEGEIILPKLPGELIVKPALIWRIRPTDAKNIKVSYITKGLSWTANYVVTLDEKDFILSGWVNIENNSGTTYENAALKLIAGEVKRIEDAEGVQYIREENMCYSESPSPNFDEESFSDYHMYSLQHNTTLKNNQSKQINFINAKSIGYRKYYEFGRYEDKAKIMLEFENNNDNGLGTPLPKGNIKVYKEDSKDGNLEFIGEDSISHVPKNEKILLHIGEAFDIVCDRDRIDYKKMDGYDCEEYEFKIRNHKDEEIEAKISHYIHGDWQIIHSSDEFIKENSNEITYWVKVKADEEKVIKFKYKINTRISVEVK